MRPIRRFVSAIHLVGVLLIGVGCGDDFQDAPLSLSDWDHRWLATIEPGEEFDIGLRGNALHPESDWQIVEFDSAVIELDRQERAATGDPEEVDSGAPSVSAFFFSGVALGETPLAFEFVVDGERIDIAEYTVAVVEDACDAERGAVANRCGLAFGYQPQDLTELAHGQVVALEPGATLDVTLTANALYPDNPWNLVEFDADVIGIDGPTYVAADRQPGDWGPWEPDSRHSFLPAWTLRITGVALGESTLVLDIRADDTQVDLYELTVVVAEDACAIDSHRSTCDQ